MRDKLSNRLFILNMFKQVEQEHLSTKYSTFIMDLYFFLPHTLVPSMVGVVQEKIEVWEPQEHYFWHSGRHFSLYKCYH